MIDQQQLASAKHATSDTGAKRAAYVLFHAGEAYGRDNVRWYSPARVGDAERLYREYHNVGDSVVYDSTLKLLDFERFIEVDFNNPNPETVALIKASCSHGIVRGSNYFHPGMQWGRFVDFVQAIGLPLIVIGVGVQAPLDHRVAMGAESERVARAIGELSVSVGVRGEQSAQAFSDVGVKNVRVLGCPSMFRSLKPIWEKRGWPDLPPLPTPAVSCGVTLRREIGPDYVQDTGRYLAIQKRFILDAARLTRLRLHTQGELYEKFFFHGRKDLLASEIFEPVNQGWIESPDDPVLDVYRDSLFYSDDIPRFCRILIQSQLVIGFRVHGVLPALAMGVPGVLVDYDSRTNELIKTFDLPSIRVNDCTFAKAYEIARTFEYSRVEAAYAVARKELIGLLRENGIPNLLD